MTEPFEPSFEKLLRAGGEEQLRRGAKAELRAKISRHLLRVRLAIGASLSVLLLALILVVALRSGPEPKAEHPAALPDPPAAPAASLDVGPAPARLETTRAEVPVPSPPKPVARGQGPGATGRGPTPVASPIEASARRSTLAEEVALLTRAREALEAKDPTAALAVLEEHQARFPEGVMRLEREATTWMARCAIDRRSAAREALDFAASHEGMPWVPRLRMICTPTD